MRLAKRNRSPSRPEWYPPRAATPSFESLGDSPPLPGDQPALRARGKNCHSNAARPASRPGDGRSRSLEISVELPNGASKLWINDTIPQGLIYNESSLCVQGPSLQQELIAANSDGSWKICGFFGDADPAQTIEIAYNCLLENALDNQDGVVLAGTIVRMSWQEGQDRETDADEAGSLTVLEPDLVLVMQAARSFAAPDERISFTLALYHSAQSHAPAFDVDLQALLPAGLTYEPGSAQILAGPAVVFDGEGLKWHLDALDLDWNAGQKALIRFNAASLAERLASRSRGAP